MLATCSSGSLTDCRDRALLLTAFASGGRRRSEISSLRLEQLVEQDPVPADPQHPEGEQLPCLAIKLGRTKTGDADLGAQVLLIGRPVAALKAWIARAGIAEGAVFRAIDRWGHLQRRALTAQAVNLILKRRIAEAGRRGIPLLDAMQQSQHRSLAQAARYYNDAERKLGKAARIIV